MDTDQKFRKYYQTDCYRGFRKVNKRFDQFSRTTFVTFSNGKKNIYASGIYTEEALVKAFKTIDLYHAKNKHANNKHVEA